MRWLTKFEKRRNLFLSDKRVRKINRFLFLPKEIKGEVRWLEFVSIRQVLEFNPSGYDTSASYDWVDKNWVK